MRISKNLKSSGTESRVHANDLFLYHDVLDTRDSQWQKLTYLAPSKTRHVSDALKRRRPETVPGTSTRSITLEIVDMSTFGLQYTEFCESVLPNAQKLIA